MKLEAEEIVDKVTFDNAQLQKLESSIDALQDHSPYWIHFLVSALPIFLASLLGLTTALFLEWLKNKREKQKSIRECREKELALLSGVNTAIAFNVEALIHTVTQQVLPHREQSYAALKAINRLGGGQYRIEQFDRRLHSEFRPMITRCPIPYLEDVNLWKDLPFLIAKDPELIKTSGWIATYVGYLKAILSERNKLIDKVTIDNPKDFADIPSLKWQIEAQVNVANAEIVNSYQLLLKLQEAIQKIENIIRSEYKDVFGPKLRITQSEVLVTLMARLEQIAREIFPDWPPPEPPEI